MTFFSFLCVFAAGACVGMGYAASRVRYWKAQHQTENERADHWWKMYWNERQISHGNRRVVVARYATIEELCGPLTSDHDSNV